VQSPQGLLAACLVARDEHDPGAHACEPSRGDLTYTRSCTRDDNDLTLHMLPNADVDDAL
jgi:hypothetical protein